ncbi:unnamed protein product [Nippostrongylus brasiliensis]|uniref:BTB domain-containing protein n=1 Tax=Nippostrongylus brasiliensis TaxID=27835 RepID=A0A0N4XCS1_NIPBR|nr:unnamed protein product [Nippostrongylus brasiliensis]
MLLVPKNHLLLMFLPPDFHLSQGKPPARLTQPPDVYFVAKVVMFFWCGKQPIEGVEMPAGRLGLFSKHVIGSTRLPLLFVCWRPNSVALSAFIMKPIEYLLNDVDRVLKRLKPQNLDELEAIIKETWSAIPAERCMKLVDSMRNCFAVIKSKGYRTEC